MVISRKKGFKLYCFSVEHFKNETVNRFLSLFLLFLVSCGGGGGSSNPSPTINLTLSPNEIVLANSTISISATYRATDSTNCQMTDYLGKTESKSSTSPSADASNVETIGGTKTFEYIPPALSETRDIAIKEINFSVTCTGKGGSSSVTKSIPVYEGIFGQVVDGPIGNATVFIDDNENGVLDSGETSTVSESDGSFLIKKSNSPLTNSSVFLPPKRIVALGGNDSSTLVSLDKIFLIHDPADELSSLDSLQCSSGRNPCNAVVSPLSTIAAFMEDPASNLKLKHLNLSELDSIYSYNHWEGGFNSDLSFPFNLAQYREKNEQLTILAIGFLNIIKGYSQNQNINDTKDVFKALALLSSLNLSYQQSP